MHHMYNTKIMDDENLTINNSIDLSNRRTKIFIKKEMFGSSKKKFGRIKGPGRGKKQGGGLNSSGIFDTSSSGDTLSRYLEREEQYQRSQNMRLTT